MAHRLGLVRYANGITGDHGRAEDVVQEAYLRFSTAVVKAPSLDEPVGYLYRIVRNLAIDTRRRYQREEQRFTAEAGADIAEKAADQPLPAAIAEGRDDLRVMRAAMDELPERTRIALEMHRFGEMTFKDIAEHLGISVGLAHRLVIEGLEHCRERLCRG